LTKPAGSLGLIESVAVELAGLQHDHRPRAANVPIIIFVGDHGIAARGVSAYPQDVTIAMLSNFASGGAAISVLARELGATLHVVDAGSRATDPIPGVVADKPRHGTRDFSVEPALTPDELAFALTAGRRALERATVDQPDIVLLGEMGIGNTTASAAVASALLGASPADVTGSGTGLDATAREHKAKLIAGALALHKLTAAGVEPAETLTAVGGLEIAALVGAIVSAAQHGLPVLVDGFIVSVAALAATRLNPSCRPSLLFSHRSAERGHRLVLNALEARPLLDLDLRLGEGSGAALALPLIRLACALHNGMATFAEAAVPDRTE
jgi:nicotinate-nucleotide--dimethylbenzimidazole phosphoribosyltransferase